MGWLESRIQIAEQRLESLYRRLTDLAAQLANVRQQLVHAFQQTPAGGGGGSAPYFFYPTTTLAAGTGPPSGTPASLASQTLYPISGGAWGTGTTAAVYNGMPNALASGKLAIALQNADGTFTAINQSC